MATLRPGVVSPDSVKVSKVWTDGASPIDNYVPWNGSFGGLEEDPIITRLPRNRGLSGAGSSSTDLKVTATYQFVTTGGSSSRCRGKLILRNESTKAEQVFYTSTTNTTAASITATITIPASALEANTTYYVHVHSDTYSPASVPNGYNQGYGFYFVTDQTPQAPTWVSPANGTTIPFADGSSSYWTFEWNDEDADKTGDGISPFQRDYGGWEMQQRLAVPPGEPSNPWVNVQQEIYPHAASWYQDSYSSTTRDMSAGVSALFKKYVSKPGTYEFRVRTFDLNASLNDTPEVPTYAISPWSEILTIYVVAPYLPPQLISPVNEKAVITEPGTAVDFEWLFRDPRTSGGTQASRDVRVRDPEVTLPVVWNLLTNPSAEVAPSATAGWQAFSSAYSAVRGTVARNGSYGLTMTRQNTALTNVIAHITNVGHANDDRIEVTPGEIITAGVYGRISAAPDPTDAVRIGVEWLRADGSSIGINWAADVTVTSTSYFRATISVYAHAEAVTMRVHAQYRRLSGSTAVAGLVTYWDSAIVSRETLPFYFDGTSSSTAEWEGEPNASRSFRDPAWRYIIPTADNPGSEQMYSWINGSGSFTMKPGYRYEWQAKTVSTPGSYDSGWSQSGYFWAVPAPNSGPTLPGAEITFPDQGLGCGVNRYFLFNKGGTQPLGEITHAVRKKWERLRDDTSGAEIKVMLTGEEAAPEECHAVLAMARSWIHELVIFRDNGAGLRRVWEGPIFRVTHTSTSVHIFALDVSFWLHQRILRSGFSDGYRKVGNEVVESPSATSRVEAFIQNALAYDDPNVLRYLQVIRNEADGKTSRTVPSFSTMVGELLDDFAAKSGIDYTVVGRRILVWDSTQSIGLLPEMRDHDLNGEIKVTEFGIETATVCASTNNNGVYGLAENAEAIALYGYIEKLTSSTSEQDDAGSDQTLTAEARQRLEATLRGHAKRSLSTRYPSPVLLELPNPATLNPDLQVGINELVPGVRVPMRSDSTLMSVSQMQRLDSLTVLEEGGKAEVVTAVFSPAPYAAEGEDA